jgi:hypothetical protein
VWDPETMRFICCIDYHRGGVGQLAFAEHKPWLASVGLDKEHGITVHDWSQGGKLVASGKVFRTGISSLTKYLYWNILTDCIFCAGVSPPV